MSYIGRDSATNGHISCVENLFMMIKQTLESNISHYIQRFQKAVLCHFGATIEYVSVSPANAHIRDELLKNSPLKKNEEWVFAVHTLKSIVGWAIVKCDQLNDDKLREKFIDFIEVFLEAPFEMSERIKTLEEIEVTLNRQFVEAGGGSNVIPFRRENSIIENDHSVVSLRPKTPLGFSVPLLISGQSEIEIFKMALELHELSGRFAFVHLKDIDLSDQRELLNLGPITIFIPNIENLDLDLQQKISTYLSSFPSVLNPQIIVGSLLASQQLASRASIDRRLLSKLQSCHLKMDRPFREYRREGIFEFYLASLVQRPTGQYLN